jgi:alkaline phosphatase
MQFPYPITNKLLASILLLFLSACSLAAQFENVAARRDAYAGPKPKYIFLFIGDGYGLAQSEAAGRFQAALGGQERGALVMNTLPSCGLATTYAADRLITDSAAAGTALATGRKTSCGTIGMDAERKAPYGTVAERAHASGMRVGIVTSVPINHATPACFYAHVAGRFIYYDIGKQLSESGFEYFAGGCFIDPEGDVKVDPAKDKSNVGQFGERVAAGEKSCITLAKERGYRYVDTRESFNALKSGEGKILVAIPAQAGASLPMSIDQKPGQVTLADFTRKGIELLDGPEGFFMMVEGGEIDWACHANDAATALREVLDFDRAVAEAVTFYNKHPAETLIIVTSDHETGGFAIGSYRMHYESNLKLLANQKASSGVFGAKVAAYRAAHPKGGDANEALAMVRENFGLGDSSLGLALDADDLATLLNAFHDSMRDPAKLSAGEKVVFANLYDAYDPLTVTACHLLAAKAGLGWTSYAHTACPVPVRAVGPSSELYSGFIDNTDVGNNIFKVLGK